jgi:hypothetical protein
MSRFGHLALLALLLVSAVIVVVSPAFATPKLTTSTGTRPDGGAVSPYFTPIGSATSSITINQSYGGSRRGSSFVGRDKDANVVGFTCDEVRGSGHVLATHTRLRITSLAFGRCTVDGQPASLSVTFSANATTPCFLHLRRGTAPSWEGTLELTRTCTITVLVTAAIIGNICQFTIAAQSVRLRNTDTNTQLETSDRTVILVSNRVNSGRCPEDTWRASTGELSSVTAVRYRHDTATTERAFRVDTFSPVAAPLFFCLIPSPVGVEAEFSCFTNSAEPVTITTQPAGALTGVSGGDFLIDATVETGCTLRTSIDSTETCSLRITRRRNTGEAEASFSIGVNGISITLHITD